MRASQVFFGGGGREECCLDREPGAERLGQDGVTGLWGACVHLCVCTCVCVPVCAPLWVRVHLCVRASLCVCGHLCDMELAGGSGHSRAEGSGPVRWLALH